MAHDFKLLTQRFLSWNLPKSVCSDLCVTNRDYQFPRSGTNLLTGDEAEAMLRHVLAIEENQTPETLPENYRRLLTSLASKLEVGNCDNFANDQAQAYAKALRALLETKEPAASCDPGDICEGCTCRYNMDANSPIEVMLEEPTQQMLEAIAAASWSYCGDTQRRHAHHKYRKLRALVNEAFAQRLNRFDKTFAIMLLSAAARSGDPKAIELAAQLAGAAPCEDCGFVNYHCKCKPAKDATWHDAEITDVTKRAALDAAIAHEDMAGHPWTATNLRAILSDMSQKQISFKVGIATHRESHRLTYNVCVARSDRDTTDPFNQDGIMTVFVSEKREEAETERAIWDAFLTGAHVTRHIDFIMALIDTLKEIGKESSSKQEFGQRWVIACPSSFEMGLGHHEKTYVVFPESQVWDTRDQARAVIATRNLPVGWIPLELSRLFAE